MRNRTSTTTTVSGAAAGKKTFMCESCGAKFRRIEDCRRHIYQTHKRNERLPTEGTSGDEDATTAPFRSYAQSQDGAMDLSAGEGV